MPAVTIDASIASSGSQLFPNPIPPIYGPILTPAKNASVTPKPVNIGSLSAGDIGAPVIVTSQSAQDVNAPVIVASLTESAISAPLLFTSASQSSVPNPTAYTALTFAGIAIPSIYTSQSSAAIAAPVAYTDEDAEVIPAPTLITPNALPSEDPPFALNHARILYDNLLLGSGVTSSTGSNPSHTLIPNTANRWTFSASGWIKFVLPANQDIDTICIGAHNLSSGGYTVTPYYRTTDGGALTIFDSAQVPSDDTAIMWHIDSSVNAKVIEIHTTIGSGSGFVGSIYAGEALQMQRPFFSGHTPINLSAVTDYFSSRTESGNFIGREIRSREFKTSASWNNLSDNWYRTYFQPFVLSAKTLPFYFAWNLRDHPTDVGYCMTSADIAPSYSGVRDLMSVSFDMIGVG